MKRAKNEKKILLIEDVPAMAELMSQVIERIPGVKLSAVAQNTWEARLAISRAKPDLVLLDEILPGESSGEFLKELNGEGIPVILITSMENPTHALPRGALSRLSKPGWDSFDQDCERFSEVFAAYLLQ